MPVPKLNELIKYYNLCTQFHIIENKVCMTLIKIINQAYQVIGPGLLQYIVQKNPSSRLLSRDYFDFGLSLCPYNYGVEQASTLIG